MNEKLLEQIVKQQMHQAMDQAMLRYSSAQPPTHPLASPNQADLGRSYYERTERSRQRRGFVQAFDPNGYNPYAMVPDQDKGSQPSGMNYQSYQLAEAEREYEMRRSEVVKQLGPPPDAREQFNRWARSLAVGAPPTEILGTSINLKLESERRGGGGFRHQATVVRGYRILTVVLQGEHPPEVGVLACYSPLLNDLVGDGFHIDCGYSALEFNPRVEVCLHQIPDLKRDSPEPLTNMQSKRIAFYKHLSKGWHHTGNESCLYHKALHPHIDPCWFLEVLCAPEDRDPVLAAAAYLKSYPAYTLKQLWADYDRWGPIDNLYGAAMIHLDKFRSW